jgi:polyhydroxyalkanoate synthesis regulator phasin
MAQAPDWQQLIEAGMQFTELRRSQAKRIAQELMAQGQIARDQLASTVDELVDLSRRRTEELSRIVRQEVQRQLGALGLATKEDLERVERRVAAITGTASGAKKAPAKKAAAKKAPAKKATGTSASKATKASGGSGRAAADGTRSA